MKKLAFAIAIALANLSTNAMAFVPNPYKTPWVCQAVQGHWSCQETNAVGYNLYSKNLTTKQKQNALTHALGWIPDNSDSVSNCSVCGGHYYEPKLPWQQKHQKSLAKLGFDYASLKLKGSLTLEGNVEVTQPDRTLYANQATLYRNPKTQQLETIAASGNIRLRQKGQLLLGAAGNADLTKNTAQLTNANYLLRVKPNWSYKGKVTDKNFTGYARGSAAKIVQSNKDLYTLYDATYTTAPPTANTWQISASKITLDRKSGRGVAKNTVLKIQKLPIFYWPYFTFPLNDNRQSGFLYPQFGSSSDNGIAIGLPYYFNLAPNYDDTLTPTIYSKRGVMLSNQFRYLTKVNSGIMQFNYLPFDRKNKHSSFATTINNHGQYSANLSSNLDFNYINDQNYLKNFSNESNAVVANKVLLNQYADIKYDGPHWNIVGLVQSYQIVNPSLFSANRPYSKLPEINLTGQYPSLLKPFSVSLNTQFINFKKNSLNGVAPVNAQRLNIAPEISLPLRSAFGYITPQLILDSSSYQLENRNTAQQPNATVNRNLPILDLDSGIYFDRDFKLYGKQYSESLEPRLFYLYVPYVNQQDIPIFDTSVTNFNYSSLFATNRFSGIDRVSNANQLSSAISTNINNSKGQQIIHAAIGQIYYFENRKVSLCQTSTNPTCISTEDPNYQQSTSDLAGTFSFSLNNEINLQSNLSFNETRKRLDSQSYQLQYIPNYHHIFNFGYQEIRHDYALLSTQDMLNGQAAPRLSQLTSSFVWKFMPAWELLGKWNYSLNAKRTIDVFSGVEYDSCSWAVRFIIRRYIINNNPNTPYQLTGNLTTATMLQFELKGLGSTSSSSEITQLLQQIPGYSANESGFN